MHTDQDDENDDVHDFINKCTKAGHSIKLVSIYKGIGHLDSDFGNGTAHTVGYYSSEEEAREAVKTAGGWGSPGKIKPMQAFLLKDKYFLIEEVGVTTKSKETLIKEKALAKLTEEEKKVLKLI